MVVDDRSHMIIVIIHANLIGPLFLPLPPQRAKIVIITFVNRNDDR